MMNLLLSSVASSAIVSGGPPPSGGAPTVSDFTSNAVETGNSTLSLTKPTGVEVGDLLILAMSSDSNTGANLFPTPADWNLRVHVGNNTADASVTVFERVADGTEGATLDFTGLGTLNRYSGFYLLIKGAELVESMGAQVEIGSAASGVVPSLQSLADDALSLVLISSQGQDTGPYSDPPTDGYAFVSQLVVGASSSGHAAGVATKTLALAGDSGAPEFTLATTDGIAAINLILRSASAPDSYPVFHPDLIPGTYSLSGKVLTNDASANNSNLFAAGAKQIRGKRYWELAYGAGALSSEFGIINDSFREGATNSSSFSLPGATNDGVGVIVNSGQWTVTSSPGGTGSLSGVSVYSAGIVVMIAYDADTGDVWFGVDGVWSASGDPAAGTGANRNYPIPFPYFALNCYNIGVSAEVFTTAAEMNFTIPTGFTALDD